MSAILVGDAECAGAPHPVTDAVDAVAALKLQGLWPQLLVSAASKVPGWSSLPPSTFQLTLLPGGMSNLMVLVHASSDVGGAVPTTVVARLLSVQLDAVIDRAREAAIVLHLSSVALGPRVYGFDSLQRTAQSGLPPVPVRFEEFIPGRTLGIADLQGDKALLLQMARVTAQFHAQRPALPGLQTDVLAASQHVPEAGLRGLLNAFITVAARISQRISAALEAGPTSVGFGAGRRDGLVSLQRLLVLLDWQDERDWVIQRLRDVGSPVVLVHGDLQAGNWIQCFDPPGKLVLIDYEYSRYDFRAFDLGNLACEFTFSYTVAEPPGYSFDADGYPSAERLRGFFDAYVDAAPASSGGLLRLTADALAAEVDAGIAASHLYWTLWSALMGAGQLGVPWGLELEAPPSPARGEVVDTSPVASGHSVFDYVHYGFTRAHEYLRLRGALRS